METNNLNLKNYIDDSESEKLLLKISKLEEQVKKLGNENNVLKAKLNNLENILEKVCAQLKIQTNLGSNSDIKTSIIVKTEDEIEETWLYYIKKNVSKDKIVNALNFGRTPVVIELKVDDWANENNVLIDMLNSFPKFKEFSEDWSSMSNQQLIHFLQTILSSTLVSDTVIILRNIPLKSHRNYDNILANIATVAEIMYTTWEELEDNNELMGKMALVLESDEEMQILNIIKNNSRLILIVDSLF
jgi:predicted nuclease with TOPRIM domain